MTWCGCVRGSEAPTHSDGADQGPARLRPTDVAAAPGRLRRAELLDAWLARLLPERAGLTLVAVGGLGRREPAPYGDLDLVLVHDGAHADISSLADAMWYPIWDSGLRLDHSVRTVEEAVSVAGRDAIAGLGLLDVRWIAGDADLANRLRRAATMSWRAGSATLLPALRAERNRRSALAGDTAYLVEPDLKEGRGGLRDVLVLRGIAAAQVCDAPSAPVEDAYRHLLDVRDALQIAQGRGGDVLIRQEQIPVAAALALSSADELLRGVFGSARTIGFAAAAGWRRATPVRHSVLTTWRGGTRRRRTAVRVPVLEGAVVHDGEVSLARAADPGADATLALRVATAAAEMRLPIAPASLAVLADRQVGLPTPWPRPALNWFIRLLAAGRGIVDVFEALDQSGLLLGYLPEWERIRAMPQHHPAHLYSVDRHLVETAAIAAELTRRVRRPDLLVLGALFHDIGKGSGRDHCVEGAEIAASLVSRMGLDEADGGTVIRMVDQHLLLPHTAMRRDPADPATIGLIEERIDGRVDLLDLLYALAEADARATGPGVWSPWRAHVVGDLVAHVSAALRDRGGGDVVGGGGGGEGRGGPDDRVPTDDEWKDAPLPASQGSPRPDRSDEGPPVIDLRPDLDGFEVSVDAADRPGLLSQIAGILALHQLEIRQATVSSIHGRVRDVFAVRPRFGRPPEASLLAADLRSSLAGTLPLADRLRLREHAYRRDSRIEQPTEVFWYDAAAAAATVVEVRTNDSAGLLYRLTRVFEQAGIDVLSARVETFGADAIDVFYLPMEATQTGQVRETLSALLRAATDRP